MKNVTTVHLVSYVFAALTLVGCGERALETQVNNIGSIEGEVSSKTSSLGVDDVYSLACSSWTAKLYEASSSDGKLGAAPLLTTNVAANGKFKFDRLSSVQVKVSNMSYPRYVVLIEGCGKQFQRPVTSPKGQDITPTSDLLSRSLSLLTRNGRTNQQVSLSSLSQLISGLEAKAPSTLYDVYSAVLGDAELKTLFVSTYGFDPSDLQYLPPEIRLGLNPATANENANVNFLVALNHWHPGYPKRALWYDGNTYLGEGETASILIGKNMQGSHTIIAKAGYSTGPTSIDSTKATAEASFSLNVANTFPAVAPTLTRTTPSGMFANSRNLTLSLATGASLANCQTFTRLALTEEQMTAPISPSEFTLSCDTVTAQALNYTLATTGEGNKTLRLWAMDSSGNVSAASSDLVVALDTQAPVAPTLTLISAAYSNATTVQVQNANCNGDATKILFSSSNTTPLKTDANWQACLAQNYNVTVATGDGAKTIYAFLKDDADFISPYASVAMTLDQTLPVLNLTAAPTLNQRLRGGATFTVSWTSTEVNFPTNPVKLELSSDGGTTWTTSVASLAASGSTTWTVPSYSGSTFKIRMNASDRAGNTGSSTASPAFIIDSTAPNVTLTSLTGGQLLKGGATAAITWTATDVALATNPITISGSTDAGVTWSEIASNLAHSGTYTWTVPSIDTSTYRVRVTAVDAVGLSGSASSTSSITIDTAVPNVTLLSLVGGQTIPGSGAVSTIAWSASDARLTSTPITLSYSADSGSTWTQIAASLANSGSYSWPVSVADATTYRVRVTAVDQVGNTGMASSTANFTVSSAAPRLTQTTALNNIVSKTLAQVTYGGACETGLTVNVTGTETTSFSCPAGTWSWTTATYATDGTRTFTFTQTNATPISTAVAVTWKRDTVAPALSSVTLNSGDPTTAIPLLRVDVTSLETNIDIRFGMADGSGNCQINYADTNWESHASLSATHTYSVPVGDGLKKVCVWTRDAALNVSVFSPVTGADGVNTDSITLEAGTPPIITAFSVVNDATGELNYLSGQRVRISWTVTDLEGLSKNPITLDYTLNNGTTWTPIVTDYGGFSTYQTSYSETYLAFNAPTANVFRVRIRATDSAGNTASPVISNVQNANRWSVYAGSTDRGIGGEAKSLRLNMGWTGQYNAYAVSPINGDIYVLTDYVDVVRIDRSSGLSSKFLSYGALNLVDGAAIPATPLAHVQMGSRLVFDRNGKLYVGTYSDTTGNGSITIWQFDLVQNKVRKYLGGGSVFNASATPATAQVTSLGFAFDDANSLYYFAYCTPGSFSAASTVRLMKATQNPDGSAGVFSIVAGNCVRGNPTYGSTATGQPISNNSDGSVALLGQVAVNGDGSSIYFRIYTEPMKKIQGAKIYSSAVNAPASDFQIDSKTNRLYQSHYGEVVSWTLTAGNGGEVMTRHASNAGVTADCWNDGKPALQACLASNSGASMGPDRLIYFIDNVDGTGIWRLRYIDSSGAIRTAAGGKPVYGEGMSRDLIQVGFNGIYYKQASEPNQAAFPAGLYFTAGAASVMGYVTDTGPMSIIWGNQKSGEKTWTVGDTIGTEAKFGSNGYIGKIPMTFDSKGLPWLRLDNTYLMIDADRKIVARSDKSVSGFNEYWDDATPGESPKKYGAAAYSGARNISLKKDEGVFIMGRSYITSLGRSDASPLLRYHDYKNDIIQHIMGASGSTSTADMDGSLQTQTLYSSCTNTNIGCSPRFEENDPTITTDDVLYFTENRSIRKITNPLNPAGNSLTTFFTTSLAIQNFILSPDKKYIYYVAGPALYCHAISAADVTTLCKNIVANHVNLGPPTGMANLNLLSGDHMTWRTPTSLLVNTNLGEIYEFNTAP